MDFPAAESVRRTKERQHIMKTARSTGTGTATTDKNQSASPAACSWRTKIAWQSALCFLVAANLLCLPRTGLSASISCGQTVGNTITNVTQVDQYSYAGTAGQILSIGFGSWTQSGNPMTADIYNPSEQMVTNVAVANDGKGIRLTLASTGTYTILVHVVNYDDTGSYYLSIQSVTGGGCNGKGITCGKTVSTNTTAYTQIDAYSYSGTAGEMLSVGFGSWTQYGNPMTADIYNPSGQMVTNVAVARDGKGIRLTLASTGTYTILVHVVNYDDTGSYYLSIQSVTGGGCNGRQIVCGQSVSADIISYTEADAYSYTAVAGEMLSIGFGSSTGYGNPMTADIYNPSGQMVTNVAVANGGKGIRLTLASAGTYTILVHVVNYDDTGSYSLGIQS